MHYDIALIHSPVLFPPLPKPTHSPSNAILLLRILHTMNPNTAPPIPITPKTIPRTASTGSLGAFPADCEVPVAGPLGLGTGEAVADTKVDVAAAPDANCGSDGAAAPGLEAAGAAAGATRVEVAAASGTGPAPLFSGSTDVEAEDATVAVPAVKATVPRPPNRSIKLSSEPSAPWR